MYTDSLELQIPGQMTNVTSSEMKITSVILDIYKCNFRYLQV